VVVVVAAFAVVLVDTVLGTVAALCRVPPDVLQAAMSAAHVAATVRRTLSLSAFLATDTGAARFIRTFPASASSSGCATLGETTSE
jgi:hypothetical protein